MRSLEDLPEDELKIALDAADALMRFKVYLPPDGLLLMLVSRFRDDVREQTGAEPQRLGIPEGHGHMSGYRPVAELTTGELRTVGDAVSILMQPNLVGAMDDPALPMGLKEYRDVLIAEKTQRQRIGASFLP